MTFNQKLALLAVVAVIVAALTSILAAILSQAFRLEAAAIVGVVITQLVILAGAVIGILGSKDQRNVDGQPESSQEKAGGEDDDG